MSPCMYDVMNVIIMMPNLVLSDLDGLVRLILHVESHMVYRVLIFHAVVKCHNLHIMDRHEMQPPQIPSIHLLNHPHAPPNFSTLHKTSRVRLKRWDGPGEEASSTYIDK